MRIALTTWGFPTTFSKSANGIGTYTAITAKYMANMGHDVFVITTNADGMPASYSIGEKIRVFQSPQSNGHWYLSKVPFMPQRWITYAKMWEIAYVLAKKARDLHQIFSFDVIEVGPPTAGMFPWLVKLQGVKIVTTLHGSTRLFYKTLGIQEQASEKIWNSLEAKSSQASHLLISPSQYIADFYAATYSRQPHVLPLPVEPIKTARRTDSRALKILALGGTGTDKGSDLILASMRKILAEHPHARLSVIAGAKNPDFIAFKETTGFHDRVTLMPWLPSLTEAYARHDIFISASRFETFGLSVAEALAAGMTVLVSDIPPHRELVKNGERGLVFSRTNTDTLCEQLDRALRDESLRKTLGQNAQQWTAKELNPTVLTQKRLDLYTTASLLKSS